MRDEVRMPALGQTSDQLLITTWLKAEGDTVRLGDPLCEVETDKAMVQVESFAAGTLLSILHEAGETVEVGTPIAYIGVKGEQVPGDSSPAPCAGTSLPVPIGNGAVAGERGGRYPGVARSSPAGEVEWDRLGHGQGQRPRWAH